MKYVLREHEQIWRKLQSSPREHWTVWRKALKQGGCRLVSGKKTWDMGHKCGHHIVFTDVHKYSSHVKYEMIFLLQNQFEHKNTLQNIKTS